MKAADCVETFLETDFADWMEVPPETDFADLSLFETEFAELVKALSDCVDQTLDFADQTDVSVLQTGAFVETDFAHQMEVPSETDFADQAEALLDHETFVETEFVDQIGVSLKMDSANQVKVVPATGASLENDFVEAIADFVDEVKALLEG